jgi:hypothetical protein
MSLKKIWGQMSGIRNSHTSSIMEERTFRSILFWATIFLIMYPALFFWSHKLFGIPAVMNDYRKVGALILELLGIICLFLNLFRLRKYKK